MVCFIAYQAISDLIKKSVVGSFVNQFHFMGRGAFDMNGDRKIRSVCNSIFTDLELITLSSFWGPPPVDLLDGDTLGPFSELRMKSQALSDSIAHL